jgi:serine/threonine protein phosphatase PrpC
MTDITRPQPLHWQSCGITHPGSKRTTNEDAIACRDDLQLWLVADGMGGHNRGDLASRTLVQTLEHLGPQAPLADAVDALEDCIHSANQAILQYSQQSLDGAIMGSTLVAVLLRGNLGYVTWVGDSRLYRWRSGQLHAITRDHSRLQELIDRGHLSAQSPADHPEANIITRALGVEAFLQLDMTLFSAQVGDTFLLCSDGLYNALDETLISDCLQAPSSQEACDRLLAAALAQHARDNVSALVIRAQPWRT